MPAYPFEDLNKLWSASYAALQPFDQPNLHIWGELGRKQVEFINLCAEWGNRELQLLMSPKDPLEMFAAQSDVAMEFSTKFAEQSRAAIALMMEAAQESMACFDRSESLRTETLPSVEPTKHLKARRAAA